jgi:hypothetical protein
MARDTAQAPTPTVMETATVTDTSMVRDRTPTVMETVMARETAQAPTPTVTVTAMARDTAQVPTLMAKDTSTAQDPTPIVTEIAMAKECSTVKEARRMEWDMVETGLDQFDSVTNFRPASTGRERI